MTRRSSTPLLGEFIADTFDSAARFTTDPREVARLATEAVIRLLQGASGHGRIRLAAVALPATR